MDTDFHTRSPENHAVALRGVRTARRPRHLAAALLEGNGWTATRMACDAVLLIAALVLARALTGAGASLLDLLPAATMLTLGARGMYRRRIRVSLLDGAAPLAAAATGAALILVVAQTYATGAPDAAYALTLWATSLGAIALGRGGLVTAQHSARDRGLAGRPAIIVGGGVVGTRLAQRLADEPRYGLRPVGFLDVQAPVTGSLPLLGKPDELREIVRATGAEHVILAFGPMPDSELAPVLRDCAELAVDVSCVPRLFESTPGQVAYEPIGALPLVRLRRLDTRGARFTVKHGVDRLVAAAALLALAPLLLAIAVAVRLGSPGPALYRQRRVGRDGEAFDMLKFRSMRVDDDDDDAFRPAPGDAPGGVEGADRRTAVGRLLRRTSLDELPQLLNVLRGEMSLVGPRPERPEFARLFEDDLHRYDERHRVRSGMTGWAQVHGLRGQTSLADRVELDNFYIEHWSLKLDLKIAVMTVAAVVQAAE